MDFNPDTLLQNLALDLNTYDSELAHYKGKILQETILKKYVQSSSLSLQLDRDARSDFIRRNDLLSQYVVPRADFVDRLSYRLSRDLQSDVMADGVTPDRFLRLSKIVQLGYCGPGASIGASGDDFYSKLFESRITATSTKLIRYFLATAPERWKKALPDISKFDVVPGSRLSSVPKDRSKNRTICVEPSLNMYFQLGAKTLIERCLLKRYQIDISNQQEFNKSLAQRGSIDGSLATIDLSNASDMISTELCRAILPKEDFLLLMDLRSHGFSSDNVFYKMNMISTMGNGFTFPLMTLILSALCRITADDLGLVLTKNNFGVFGDDIIVPTSMYSLLTERIELLGLAVNHSKSYSSGFFRESCGGDFYHGYNVRGVYLKRLENDQDVYSIFNRLHRWSIDNNIFLGKTLSYLKGLAEFRPVPRHESFDSGFIVSQDVLRCPKVDRNGSLYYRVTQSRTNRRYVGDRISNPQGAYISALGGYIRNQQITRRSYDRSVGVIRKVTPSWDYSQDPVLLGRGLSDSWALLLS